MKPVTALLLAGICFAQQTAQLEQLRETKDPDGHSIFSQPLRAQMKFAEDCLADFLARRAQVAEEERKNVPGYSYMVEAHRNQLAGFGMMVRAAFAKAAYMATQPGPDALQTPEQRKTFRQWEEEAMRQFQGKRPRAASTVSRASARLPTRRYELFCILRQESRMLISLHHFLPFLLAQAKHGILPGSAQNYRKRRHKERELKSESEESF
jgi:hypothetical protein